MPKTPNQASSLTDWLDYMQQIHVSAIDMGLSRVMPVAEYLEIVQSAKKDAYVFTVAGTNGKGSTTAVISEICQQAGYKTALYQSPHLIDFNERVRIDGKAVADAVLIKAFSQVEDARLKCELTLSFFEMTTLAAMLIFAQADCDVWVLEVGLGGRLDVVNIIDPDLAVITNIGIDHVDWLGDTREQIGCEKAGILRQGIPLIYGSDDMPLTVAKKIVELQVTCYQADRDFSYLIDSQQDQWQFSSAAVTLSLPVPALSVHNSANGVAAIVASPLTISQQYIADGLRKVRLAGRFDVRRVANAHATQTQWIFDVAHNTEGIMFLLPQFTQLWQQRYEGQLDTSQSQYTTPKLHIIFSMLADKAINEVVQLLLIGLSQLTPKPIINWHIGVIDHPRAADKQRLIDAIKQAETGIVMDKLVGAVNKSASFDRSDNIFSYDTLAQATQTVARLCAPNDSDDIVLVYGSFHTIGAVMQCLHLKTE